MPNPKTKRLILSAFSNTFKYLVFNTLTNLFIYNFVVKNMCFYDKTLAFNIIGGFIKPSRIYINTIVL